MADECDRAQAINEQLQGDLLAAHFCRVRRLPAEAFAPTDCDDCGEPIPEARLAAAPGCIRCIDCQRAFERQLTRRA